jgi:hypothetical protein
LTPKVKVDDDVLQEIIENLYYPLSPYEFSVLGSIFSAMCTNNF